jgi:hypothetical protein
MCDLPSDDLRVWTYLGSGAGRRRLTIARRSGRAVIDQTYLDQVRRAFQRLDPAEYAACAASLDPGGLPVIALRRHDVTYPSIRIEA